MLLVGRDSQSVAAGWLSGPFMSTVSPVFYTVVTVINSIAHQPFIWETWFVKRRIPDPSIEPYPYTNGEQTRHAKVLFITTFHSVTCIIIDCTFLWIKNDKWHHRAEKSYNTLFYFFSLSFVTSRSQPCQFYFQVSEPSLWTHPITTGKPQSQDLWEVPMKVASSTSTLRFHSPTPSIHRKSGSWQEFFTQTSADMETLALIPFSSTIGSLVWQSPKSWFPFRYNLTFNVDLDWASWHFPSTPFLHK